MGHRSRRRKDSRARARVWGLVATSGLVLAFLVGAALLSSGSPVIDGSYVLDTIVMPIPATLVGEIQLDTPAELTLLKFGIESTLDLSVTYGSIWTHVNAAMSIPGLERVIFEAEAPFGPITIRPELWFAVPFETVTDINHFTNWVVIPPGDPLFVKTRIIASADFGWINIHNLLMIEDVKFPNPAADYGPLEYTVQTQSFHTGDILRITGEVYPGVTLTSVTNFCATAGANNVKGWSAAGSVDANSSLCDDFDFDSTLTLSGLEYCGIPFWLSLNVDPCDDPILAASGGGSFKGLFLHVDLAGSFGLLPFGFGGFSLSTVLCDMIDATFYFNDKLEPTSASFRGRAEIDTGMMQGTVTSACRYIAGEGVTSLTLGAAVSHGTFSGSLGCAISEQLGTLRLTSFTSRLGLTLAPATVSVQTRFGRAGLVQATLSLGVVF